MMISDRQFDLEILYKRIKTKKFHSFNDWKNLSKITRNLDVHKSSFHAIINFDFFCKKIFQEKQRNTVNT